MLVSRKSWVPPLRALCAVPSATVTLADDTSWVVARAKEIAAEVALLFVHLGLDAADSASGYAGAEVFASYKRDAAVLPEDERRIMVFIARFSSMPRLNCVARNLPSSISTDPLRMVDALAIETIAACAGLSSSRDLPEAQGGEIAPPTRWGGALPGFGVAAPAQAVFSATSVEAYLKGLHNPESARGTFPWILSRIYDRFSNRILAASPDETPSELALRADVDVISASHADPRVQVALARAGD